MAFAPDTPPRALVRYPTRGVVRRPYKPPKAPRLGAPPPPASSGIPPTTRPPVGYTPSTPTVGAPGATAVAGAVKQKVMTEAQWQAYHTAHGTTPTGTYDQYAAKRGVTVDPYRSLPDWARTQIGVMGTQSTQAQDQATKAAQWLASVTTPLVNARSAQDQAFAGNLNAVAGAYTAAGAPGVTPGSSASPGGMASGGGLSHLALGAANAQAATVGPGTQALLAGQGLGARITDQIAGAARWAGQVKSTYEKQSQDYVAKVNQWKAEQDSAFLNATMKATGVTDQITAANTRAAGAQSGQNARTAAQIAATNQRAAAAQSGANTRTAAQIAAANARAAIAAAAKTTTVAGKPVDQKKIAVDVAKVLRRPANATSGVKAGTPYEALLYGLSAGYKPKDVYKVIHAQSGTMDPTNVWGALMSSGYHNNPMAAGLLAFRLTRTAPDQAGILNALIANGQDPTQARRSVRDLMIRIERESTKPSGKGFSW